MTDSPKQDKRKRPMYPVKMSQEMHTEVFAMADKIGGTPNDVIVEAIKLAFTRPEELLELKRQQRIDELEAELLELKHQE